MNITRGVGHLDIACILVMYVRSDHQYVFCLLMQIWCPRRKMLNGCFHQHIFDHYKGLRVFSLCISLVIFARKRVLYPILSSSNRKYEPLAIFKGYVMKKYVTVVGRDIKADFILLVIFHLTIDKIDSWLRAPLQVLTDVRNVLWDWSEHADSL